MAEPRKRLQLTVRQHLSQVSLSASGIQIAVGTVRYINLAFKAGDENDYETLRAGLEKLK